MKVLYVGNIIKVELGEKHVSILPKKDFDKLIVAPGLSRKAASEKHLIGSKLYNHSMAYHYSGDQIEKQRVSKIRECNKRERLDQWESSLDELDKIMPGTKQFFEDNLRDHPELINQKLIELNGLFYEIKNFIRSSKKYIRQAINRKGMVSEKMVSNLSEYKLRKLLLGLGYTVENQFYIKPYFYDFRVGNIIIEYDGQYHTPEKDSIKEALANKHGYTILRVFKEDTKDIESLKEKLKKQINLCLRNQK